MFGQNTTNKVWEYISNTLNNSDTFNNTVKGISELYGINNVNNIKDLFNKDNLKGISESFKNSATGINSLNPSGLANVAMSGVKYGLNQFGIKGNDYSGGFDKGLDIASKYIGLVPGVGTAASLAIKGLNIINQHSGKKIGNINTQGMDTYGYNTGTYGLAGQKMSGWNTYINRGRNSNNYKTGKKNVDVLEKQNLLAGNMSYQNNLNKNIGVNTANTLQDRNRNQLYGLQGAPLLAKLGTKIPPSYFNKIVKSIEEKPKNVIPEGAFHSRKHSLPDDISEQVTKKGIPVVSKEGGELIQHAEIERRELIFHKEATDKIEKYLKQYNEAESKKEKDEIAIKCGKYVTNEILFNTEDNANMIESVT